jgi:stearoyl-CoA desaturase (Delta-9 desaturase)
MSSFFDTGIKYLLHGFLSPTPLELFFFVLATSLLTLLSVSCYLHRSQTHRAIDFVAPINYFFRFILWIFTGMKTVEWVAVHRKHHAKCDTPEDPHSPRYFGLRKILLGGADIYRDAGRNNPEIIREYGVGAPNDWFEKFFYSGWKRNAGIYLSLGIELFLFGLPALIIWPIQLLVIPVIAAGFINGVAHVWGYQRYKDGDAKGNGKVYERIGDARNVPTYGLAVGEEFHNNHHAHQESYKFSHAWYEFDLAGTLIEILMFFKLAWVPKREN